MTAGKGVQHGEMFPLVNQDKPNPLRFFQIWLNLPAKSKMVEPAYVMHWSPDIRRVRTEDGGTHVTNWAGEILNTRGVSPPPNSWASDPKHDVSIWYLEINPGATFELPGAAAGSNRRFYFLEGDRMTVAGTELIGASNVEVDAQAELKLCNTGKKTAEVLVLGGKPIGEPIAQHGPFVMNTRAQIAEAFEDYRRTQFGGWPWPRRC